MAKDPNKPRPQIADDGPPDSLVLLKDELRRRGMTQAEIEAVLRKKKRRKALAFNAVIYPQHALPDPRAEAPRIPPKPRPAKPVHRPAPRRSEELRTVGFAAAQLQLHPKTVLRFIREGRLRATRVGKSYRILNADLEAFAGIPTRAETTVDDASVTCIVDIPGVAADMAQRWARTVTSALNASPTAGAPMRAEVIYEPERSHLKIVLVGSPTDTVNLLSQVRVWLEQLRP